MLIPSFMFQEGSCLSCGLENIYISKISIICYQMLLLDGLGLFSLNCFSTCTSLVGVV
jgi:hypothetical protein